MSSNTPALHSVEIGDEVTLSTDLGNTFTGVCTDIETENDAIKLYFENDSALQVVVVLENDRSEYDSYNGLQEVHNKPKFGYVTDIEYHSEESSDDR